MLPGERFQFAPGNGVIRFDQNRAGIPHSPCRAQGGPGTFHAARMDDDRFGHRAYLPNGFLALRRVSRTGTAPKPSSLRMPLTR
jgi:hypothetical protein